MAKKTISEFVCPPEHTDSTKDFLETCRKFLIVGSSGWDADLLDFLSNSILEPAAMVHLVCTGNNRDIARIKNRFISGVSAFHAADSSGNFIAHRQGFTDYLKDFSVAGLLDD